MPNSCPKRPQSFMEEMWREKASHKGTFISLESSPPWNVRLLGEFASFKSSSSQALCTNYVWRGFMQGFLVSEECSLKASRPSWSRNFSSPARVVNTMCAFTRQYCFEEALQFQLRARVTSFPWLLEESSILELPSTPIHMASRNVSSKKGIPWSRDCLNATWNLGKFSRCWQDNWGFKISLNYDSILSHPTSFNGQYVSFSWCGEFNSQRLKNLQLVITFRSMLGTTFWIFCHNPRGDLFAFVWQALWKLSCYFVVDFSPNICNSSHYALIFMSKDSLWSLIDTVCNRMWHPPSTINRLAFKYRLSFVDHHRLLMLVNISWCHSSLNNYKQIYL